MDTFTLDQAKEHLEELLARAAKGEDVRITDAAGVVARLVSEHAAPRRSRVIFGQWKHLDEISRERLLEPLGEDDVSWLSGEQITWP